MKQVVMKVLILFKGNIYLFRLYQLTNMHRLLLNTGTVYLHVFIPQAMSCGGYNVFDQSVSPVFLVSATPLKPLNRIS